MSQKKIKRIVKLVYLSAFLKNEKPLSCMLLAPPENSKTHFLTSYETRYSHVATDLSYRGLIDLLLENKKLKHIVIPDFLKVTEKNQSTKKSIVSCLNAFLEEGIYSINLANKEKIDLKGRNGGIITSTTKMSFLQNRKRWAGMGFQSRCIFVSWENSKLTMRKIMKKITNEENTTKKKPNKVYSKCSYVKNNKELDKDLIELACYSPRRLKNLKVLLKALALDKGKKMPDREDLKELKELGAYINTRFNEI